MKWIAVFLLTVAATLWLQKIEVLWQEDHHELADEAFELVCAEVESRYNYTCEGIEAPTIVITGVLPWGYWGAYYPGEKYIFVNLETPSHKKWLTILHETTHYVAHNTGLISPYDNCTHEETAREVSAAITSTEVDPTWVVRYGCAAKASS